MKVLIVSVTCGQGHNSTAKAIKKQMESYGIECTILDAFEHINRILAKALDDGYQLSTKYISKPYASMYKLAEHRKKNAEDASSVKVVNTLLASKLRSYIEEYNPDVIISTHCFAAAMVDILKEKKIVHSINIGIVTDFTAHPFWEESIHFDYIVTPSELLNLQLQRKGFGAEKILPFGIPIDPKFAVDSVTKQQARETLGLDPNKLTVLVMSGSMGFGNIRGVVASLDRLPSDFQAIVVCGNNADAKEEIDGMRKTKTFLTYGYVNNVDFLMSAADCIVTKPGGLTSSEALAKRLPMIIVNPIPGQEDRNSEFLLNSGAAMAASETCPVDEVIYQFLQNPNRRKSMAESIDFIRHPESTKTLCDFIVKLQSEKKPD